MEEQGAETVVFNWGRPCLPTVYIWSCLQMPLVVQLCCEELGGMVVLLAFVYGGQGCCSASYNTQDSPSTENDLDPNANDASVEKLCGQLSFLCSLAVHPKHVSYLLCGWLLW